MTLETLKTVFKQMSKNEQRRFYHKREKQLDELRAIYSSMFAFEYQIGEEISETANHLRLAIRNMEHENYVLGRICGEYITYLD